MVMLIVNKMKIVMIVNIMILMTMIMIINCMHTMNIVMLMMGSYPSKKYRDFMKHFHKCGVNRISYLLFRNSNSPKICGKSK